jgi:hypothetical protein
MITNPLQGHHPQHRITHQVQQHLIIQNLVQYQNMKDHKEVMKKMIIMNHLHLQQLS